jgi:hypothetical protein
MTAGVFRCAGCPDLQAASGWMRCVPWRAWIRLSVWIPVPADPPEPPALLL